MSSVAEELRKENLHEVLHLSAEERIALALELGDFDLALYCARQNLQPSEATERLRLVRQIGRRTRVSSEERE